MTFITAFFNALAAVPAIFNLVKQFADWISAQVIAAEKRKKEADMAKAAELAQKKKDTSGLDQMFDPSKGGKK